MRRTVSHHRPQPEDLLLENAPGRSPQGNPHAQVRKLYALTSALTEALTPQQVAKAVIAQGSVALGATSTLVSALNEERTHLELLASGGASAARVRLFEHVPVYARSPVADALRQRTPLLLESPEELERAYPELVLGVARKLENASWALYPLFFEGAPLGVISLGFPTPRTFSEEEREFAAALTQLCAQALERARLYESERRARVAAERSQQRFAFVAEVSATLGECRSEQAVFDAMRQLLVPRLADWMTVRMLQEDDTLSVSALAHVEPRLESTLREIQQAYRITEAGRLGPGRTLRTGEPSFFPSIPDAQLEAVMGEGPTASLRKIGLKGLLAVALKTPERVMGVLTLGSAREDRTFRPEDLLLAEDFARRAAAALDKARLLRSSQQRAERLKRLHALATAMAPALTREQAVQAVLTEALPSLQASTAGLFMVEPDGRSSRLVGEQGYSAAQRSLFNQLSLDDLWPVTRCLKEGVEIWLETRADYDGQFPFVEQPQRRPATELAVVCIPFIFDGRAQGCMAVTFDGGRHFPAEERDYMRTVAHHCAQALERGRLYEHERATRAQAEQSVKARDEFLSIASHELKTPLTSLKLQHELIERGLDGETKQRLGSRLSATTRQLSKLGALVDSLLDVSRMSTGKLSLDLSNVDLSALVKDVAERFAATAVQMGSTLSLDLAQVSGQWDAMRLDQVVVNLLSNALKYGAGKPVSVRLSQHQGMGCLEVRDEGIGIAARDLPRLFGRFERAVPKNYAGLGLGLYISRQIVEAMGGFIEVESVQGAGTRFTVLIPCGAPSPSPASP